MEIDDSVPAQGKNLTLCSLSKLPLATKWRVILLSTLIFFQFTILKFIIHPPMYANDSMIPGGRFSALLYFILGFILLLSGRFGHLWRKLISSAEAHHWQRAISFQLIFYFLIIYFSSRVYPTDFFAFDEQVSKHRIMWFVLLTAAIVGASFFSLSLIAPKSYWRHFLKNERITALLALAFPGSHIIVHSLAMQSEDILSKPTIAVAKFILDFFYTDVRTDPGKGILQTSNFGVVVDQMCSGYVGIGMINVFLIWYFITFKRKFRFPAILLLFPIGSIVIWLSNCLRVALIVMIGSSISSEIAMEGFHANSGWIFFIAIATGMVVISNGSHFFSRTAYSFNLAIDSVSALAIPLLVLLATTMISSAFSAEFQWLYPLRAIATGLVIFLLWRHIRPETMAPAVSPVIAGIVVFLLWIFLVPSSSDMNRIFNVRLSSFPAILSVGWIVIRLLGSVIIIPIAEELAFRGYLPILFHGDASREQQRSWQTELLPFFVSSLLFGALHSALLAGTLAGAVYYLVKLRSGRLWDAVVAHMTTNLLLSAYVLLCGQWSYW